MCSWMHAVAPASRGRISSSTTGSTATCFHSGVEKFACSMRWIQESKAVQCRKRIRPAMAAGKTNRMRATPLCVAALLLLLLLLTAWAVLLKQVTQVSCCHIMITVIAWFKPSHARVSLHSHVGPGRQSRCAAFRGHSQTLSHRCIAYIIHTAGHCYRFRVMILDPLQPTALYSGTCVPLPW